MAYEDKAVLLNAISKKLGDGITANEITKVMEIVSAELDGYDVTHVVRSSPSEQDDMVDTYVSALMVQGRSEKTIERYKYIIGRMLKAVNVTTRGITVYHLRRYLADEKKRGISDATLDGFRQIFSAYFNWLQREGLIQHNPTSNLGAIRCEKRIKQAYSDIDIERLKSACTSVRDKAIICFLLSTGCRINEMVQLNRDDIDMSSLECKVFGKGRKERRVYIDDVTGMLLTEYLKTRHDDSPALFVGKGSDRLTPGGVRCMLTKLSDTTGVANVHPHRFRRTLATNLIRRGMPIQEVAAILGHEKIDTTMRYVVLDQRGIENAYRRCA